MAEAVLGRPGLGPVPPPTQVAQWPERRVGGAGSTERTAAPNAPLAPKHRDSVSQPRGPPRPAGRS